ncbi:MAG: molybdenum ABC transporter ATP-binding protein [Burkholderiales bacterium]|nr:molybdenum ABC transporter ATP-binding protein [Burkholderiales bacterium]
MSEILARFRHGYPGFTLDVDLELPSRGVTALFGHSGSGKTTLLRCIAGLERTANGYLAIDGTLWQDGASFLPTHRRPIGYVFQEASLFPHLSVRGNLEYGAKRAQSLPAREGGAGGGRANLCRPASADFSHIVELLGIGTLLDRKPERLSGGERQRVAIARALLTAPRLLLMDEPLAALDLARKNEILPYLERLHDELEIPVLYVSHAPDEVARLADHLVVMDGGRAVAQGPLADVLSRIDLPIRILPRTRARHGQPGADQGRGADRTNATIDFATHADLPAMADLLHELFTLESDFRPERDKQFAGLKLILDNPALGRLFVLRDDGKVAGMANALITVSTALGAAVLLLEDVIVSRNWRGHGHGRALVEHVCAWAKNEGMPRVTLLADQDNAAALAFHEKLGFEKSAMVVRRKKL